jgi:hypothetical protein
VKDLFNNLYKGFKCSLHSNNKTKVLLAFKKKVKEVTCQQIHAALLNGRKYIKSIYQEIYHLDESNLMNFPMNIVNLILNIVLETGNNCEHTLGYYHFLKNEINSLKFLKTAKKVNPALFLKLKARREKFKKFYGNFDKMGSILGKMLADFLVFKPLSPKKQKALQIKTLMNLFKPTSLSNSNKVMNNLIPHKRVRHLKKWLNYIP